MRLLVVGDYRVVSEDVGSKKDGHSRREPKTGYVTAFPRAPLLDFCKLYLYIHIHIT